MDLLDRLYDQLVQAARRAPYDARRDFTIGEVYQHLIPYRSIRSELGLWELAAYEHALLRLLSGERGYLSIPDATVQEEIRRELGSPNPILGVYRDYPTVEIRVESGSAEATPAPAHAGSPARDVASPEPPAPPASTTEPAPATAPSLASSPPPDRCRGCSTLLPVVPDLRFCPTCGADQLEAPCVECGALLKAEWNFCIRCGTSREGALRATRSG